MDERRCATGFLCRGNTVTNGQRQPALVAGKDLMCEGCRRWAGRSLRSLPDDWLKLKVTIGERRAPVGDSESRRPPPGPKVLVNLNADALMGEIVTACTLAAAIVGAEINVPQRVLRPSVIGLPTSSRQEYGRLRRAVSLVGPHIDKLVADEDGVKLALRIVQAHRQALQHLGETAQREKQHLPCPFCGGVVVKEVRDLRGRESRDGIGTPEVIRCTECDAGPNQDGTFTETEYEWLSKMVRSEREEIDVLKWLLAEAQWERDVALWLAAESEWALDDIADVMGISGGAAALLEQVRTAVTA